MTNAMITMNRLHLSQLLCRRIRSSIVMFWQPLSRDLETVIMAHSDQLLPPGSRLLVAWRVAPASGRAPAVCAARGFSTQKKRKNRPEACSQKGEAMAYCAIFS